MVELMLAMTITVGIGSIAFQLFLQNQNVFRDQNLALELRQSVRAVASIMADELRRAGQGVPAYSASLDASTAEASQTFLNGTNSNAVVFRAGVRNAMATFEGTLPVAYAIGSSIPLEVEDASTIDAIVRSRPGYFVFLWGETSNSWTWVRAEVTTADTRSNPNTFTVTPRQVGGQGGPFDRIPNIVLEEAIAYRLSSDALQRGTSGDFSAPSSPSMTYQTIGDSFTTLSFTYYDEDETEVTGSDLEDRASIRRIDFNVGAETSEELASTGEKQTYAITVTIYPRNVMFY